MTIDDRLLATQLDGVVRSVPGVSALYSTAPAVIDSVRRLSAGRDATHPGLVAVTRDDDAALSITASIGVSGSAQAPRTAAAVSAAIHAALEPGLTADVTVRVSRVQS